MGSIPIIGSKGLSFKGPFLFAYKTTGWGSLGMLSALEGVRQFEGDFLRAMPVENFDS
jgi:hypothetical protein